MESITNTNQSVSLFIFQDLSSYLEQLLSKSVYYFFLGVYEKAKATDTFKKFRSFQEKIRNIPEWPDSLLEKYNRILLKNNVDDIQDVLKRIDRMYISIYMPEFNDHDSMELVRGKTFVHNVLKHAARDFFANPFVFDIEDHDPLNFYLINSTLKNSIQCALRETLMPRLRDAAQLMRSKSQRDHQHSDDDSLYRAHEYQGITENPAVFYEPEPEDFRDIDADRADRADQNGGNVFKIGVQDEQDHQDGRDDQDDQDGEDGEEEEEDVEVEEDEAEEEDEEDEEEMEEYEEEEEVVEASKEKSKKSKSK